MEVKRNGKGHQTQWLSLFLVGEHHKSSYCSLFVTGTLSHNLKERVCALSTNHSFSQSTLNQLSLHRKLGLSKNRQAWIKPARRFLDRLWDANQLSSLIGWFVVSYRKWPFWQTQSIWIALWLFPLSLFLCKGILLATYLVHSSSLASKPWRLKRKVNFKTYSLW